MKDRNGNDLKSGDEVRQYDGRFATVAELSIAMKMMRKQFPESSTIPVYYNDNGKPWFVNPTTIELVKKNSDIPTQ